MIKTLHVNFLQEKIKNLQSALLYSMSKSVLKIPTCIVFAIHVDDLGFIWLMVHRPLQDIKEFERNFPVKLNFYQKGKEYYLNVEGNASIVLEPAEIDEMLEYTSLDKKDLQNDWVFMKVETKEAEYHNMGPTAPNHGWIPSISSYITKLFTTQENYSKPFAVH